MHIKSTVLAIAAVLIAPSSLVFAQNSQMSATPAGSREAAKMVSATAAFTSNLDSRKLPVGSQFRAKLDGKVRLDNGPVLPSGTVLVGQVVEDNSQSSSGAKLALRFTEADLKNGQTVPIKATIVNVYRVPNEVAAGEYGASGSPVAWNRGTLVVDQLDAISGVDLHSRIASPNSGVFVSNKKDDIKLTPSVEVELAIAPRNGEAQQTASGS